MATVSLDFDGTIHPYTHGWVGPEPDDESPVDGALDFVRILSHLGYEIVITSCRCDTPEGLAGTARWLNRHGFGKYVERVTTEKVPAVAYVDDRAVRADGDWNEVLAQIAKLDHRL